MADGVSSENRTAKRKTKDSVFTFLFKIKKNLFRLYKELHPEDVTTTIEDIHLQTLTAVLINDLINDLGFIVKGNKCKKFVILLEAQSQWTENLTLRMLFYLAETYRRYLSETKQSEHTYKRVELPEPDLYIIYTGDKDVPDKISFKDDYFGGECPVDVRVKILKQSGTETICGQYIGFCKVYDEQRKIHKNKLECIKETIRICEERGYLAEFLGEYKKEVYTMMSELFDEEYQRNQYDIAIKEIIRAEGRAEGEAKGRTELVKSLLAVGRSIKEIAEFFKTDEAEIQGMLAMDC